MLPIPCFSSMPFLWCKEDSPPRNHGSKTSKLIRKLNYPPSREWWKVLTVKLLGGWVGWWSWQLFVVLESWGWNMYVYLSPSFKSVDTVLPTGLQHSRTFQIRIQSRDTADSKRKHQCSSHKSPCQWLNPLNPHWASLEGLPGCLSDFSFHVTPESLRAVICDSEGSY